MNILRWKRKSKKKIKFKTLVLFIFSLIMTTFAWFAYAKVLSPTLNIHMASWDMKYYIETQEQTNPIAIQIDTLYPAMDEQTITIDIENNGETLVDIEYQVKSLTIAGTSYEIVQEGQTPTTSNYIILAGSVLETDTTTSTQIYKSSIINDLEKFPFTIDIEHSAQVKPVSTGDYGENVSGKGYLKVTVNWVGDNNVLDSEWGYKVGEYLATSGASSAMTLEVSIDSYQAENQNGGLITDSGILPSTTETTPYLPTGFTKVPGTTLDTGLVIKDASGNEYVWIEVPKTAAVYTNAGLGLTSFSTTEYTNIENDLKEYSKDYRTREDVYTSYQATGISDSRYDTLKETMLQSIYQNGGFYIGRYETGAAENARTSSSTTSSETPVIKANSYPFNYVTCSQAQSIAGNMASGSHTSSLMFGLQWDLVMKYLSVKGSITDNNDINTDSTLWGNYKNNTYNITKTNSKYSLDDGATWLDAPYEKAEDVPAMLTTGANSSHIKQNIYDLAGNLAEWTFNIAFNGSSPVGGNGGDYSKEGTTSASNCDDTYESTEQFEQVGFRVTIY